MIEKIAWWVNAIWERYKINKKLRKIPNCWNNNR